MFRKDPSAELDYTLDWSAWLGTDTIATSTWTVPSGLTQPKDATSTATAATVWVGGGTPGQKYTVTNRIVTAAGRADERSIQISVVNL